MHASEQKCFLDAVARYEGHFESAARLFPRFASVQLSEGRLQNGSTGDGDDADVVFLAESLRGCGDAVGGGSRAR